MTLAHSCVIFITVVSTAIGNSPLPSLQVVVPILPSHEGLVSKGPKQLDSPLLWMADRLDSKGCFQEIMPVKNQVVYSTGIGRIRYCQNCHQPEDACRCRHDLSSPHRPGMPHDGIIRIALDKKGRSGKAGTLVVGLPDDDDLLSSLCQTLKRLCGSGGTSKQGEIFIQGDHRDKIERKLHELGYRTKRAGG